MLARVFLRVLGKGKMIMGKTIFMAGWKPAVPFDFAQDRRIAAILAALAVQSFLADYVTIGGAGVAADPATGFGFVDYTCQITRDEVTGAEFNAAAAPPFEKS